MATAPILVSVVDDDDSVRESLPDLLREFGLASKAFATPSDLLQSELRLELPLSTMISLFVNRWTSPSSPYVWMPLDKSFSDRAGLYRTPVYLPRPPVHEIQARARP